ncbi:hypothetical protein SEVIR_7G001552v4 [Setaria viridis]
MEQQENMTVMETTSVESSGMEASQVGGPGARSERLRGIKGLAETGHASTSRRSRGGQAKIDGLGGLGLKTTALVGFPVWSSKPGASPVRPKLREGGHVASSRSLRQRKAKS